MKRTFRQETLINAPAAFAFAWHDQPGAFERLAPPWEDLRVRERTGAAVVAVERGDRVFVEFDNAFMVQSDDTLFICGTPECLERYLREFDTMPADGNRA